MDLDNRRRTLRTLLAVPFGAAAMGAVGTAQANPTGGAKMDRLDVLDSKQRISEVLVAYARSNDRADEALLKSCFWPESTHHHGKFEGKSSDFVGFAFKIISGLKYACHHISNIAIEVKGDRAFSECYYFAHHRRPRKEGGEEDVFFQGRYLDFFERRAGIWKIIRRRGLSDYTSPAIPAEVTYGEWPEGQHSLRYPDDDYYRMRQEFEAKA